MSTRHDVAIPSKDVGAELQQGKAPFAGESFRQWKVVPPEKKVDPAKLAIKDAVESL